MRDNVVVVASRLRQDRRDPNAVRVGEESGSSVHHTPPSLLFLLFLPSFFSLASE